MAQIKLGESPVAASLVKEVGSNPEVCQLDGEDDQGPV